MRGLAAVITLARRCTSECAATTVEFVLVLPMAATLFAVLVQLVLLMHARAIVDYAAFAAARSAAVWLPTEASLPDEDLAGSGSEAMQRIHHAAALACQPISPATNALPAVPAAPPGPPEGDPAAALAEGGSSGVSAVPAFNELARMPRRLDYASRATTVRLTRRILSGASSIRLTCVAATVTHKLFLSVPIAATLFGHDAPPRGLDGTSAHFIDIQVTYVLPLEDEINATPVICE